MACLLGIDVGTTGAKVVLMREDGQVAARSSHEYRLLTPRPAWAEQNPADWWQAAVAGTREVLGQSGLAPQEIVGVGLSGQMHGSVFLDERNRVIRPAILWCDQRTADQCRWITERAGEAVVVEETLNPVLTGFTAPKIVWLRQNEPDAYARVRKVLLPKDYVRFLLTGEFATDVSDASGTSLLNVAQRRWSQKMLAALDLTEAMLPKVYESPEVSGRISAEAARATGLAQGTPVVAGAGDQAAGAVGNGIVRQGVISVTTGTSGVVFAHMDEPRMDPKLRTHTFCHAVPGKWHAMGVMLSAGGSLRWFRDALGVAAHGCAPPFDKLRACPESNEGAGSAGVDPYELLTREAAQAPPGCEGLIFLPYLTGERTPYPDPWARGVYFGLTLRHGRPHLVRAILEGVSYGLRDSLEILREMGGAPPFDKLRACPESNEGAGSAGLPISQGGAPPAVRASGGGARSALWRQIQADVFHAEMVTINVDEGPAFGAALLAGVGARVFASVEEACDRTMSVAERTQPDPDNSALYDTYYPIYQALYASLKDHFVEIGRLVLAAGGP